jgi:hypothetical protein
VSTLPQTQRINSDGLFGEYKQSLMNLVGSHLLVIESTITEMMASYKIAKDIPRETHPTRSDIALNPQ